MDNIDFTPGVEGKVVVNKDIQFQEAPGWGSIKQVFQDDNGDVKIERFATKEDVEMAKNYLYFLKN